MTSNERIGGSGPVYGACHRRRGYLHAIDIQTMRIRTVTVRVHDVVPASTGDKLTGVQINPRTGAGLDAALDTARVVQRDMNTVTQRDELSTPGPGCQIDPTTDRNLTGIGERAGDLHIVIDTIETQNLAACPIRHIRGPID